MGWDCGRSNWGLSTTRVVIFLHNQLTIISMIDRKVQVFVLSIVIETAVHCETICSWVVDGITQIRFAMSLLNLLLIKSNFSLCSYQSIKFSWLSTPKASCDPLLATN